MLHTWSALETMGKSGAYSPDVNAGAADASKDAADDENVHAGSSTTDG